MKRRHRRWIWGLATVVLIVTAGLVPVIAGWLHPAVARAAADATPTDNRPQVEVVRPQRGAIWHKVQAPGLVSAFEEADLYAKTSGYISDVSADIGDVVKKDRLLALIDVPELQRDLTEAKALHVAKQRMSEASDAAVDQSKRLLDIARRQAERYKAEAALAELTLKRQEELFTGKAVTQQQLDEVRSKAEIARADAAVAEAKIAGAEADVRGAEAMRGVAAAQVEVAAAQIEKVNTLIAYTRIVAPFDGTVTRRWVNRGDLVQAATAGRTTPMFTLQKLDTVRIFCEVPEVEAGRVHTGDGVSIKLPGLTGPPIDGKVTRSAGALTAASRTMRAEIDLPNPQGRLLPGMYAQVSIEIDRKEKVIVIPATALGTDSAGQFVLTIKDGHIVRAGVKAGMNEDGRVEVVEGLAEDVQIVTTAKGAPAVGAAVRVTGKP